jgi:diguanylate cyclase (GGDEF)-like protein
LTELLNRKTFDGALNKAVKQNEVRNLGRNDARALKPEETHWVAVIDVDHFKSVNDNYGHAAGDKVLSVLARLMRDTFRVHDQLYRFGGEEFVVLMRCANHEDACSALERFRARVERHSFPGVGQITASLGLAELRRTDNPGDALERADKALYYAKQNGRNQVCSFQSVFEAEHDFERDAVRA